ncbi:MAG: VWA domain-containing protein [Planctomycetales bacterium]|nr:VWA domain-containing protein [Planctomycetales bacterium]
MTHAARLLPIVAAAALLGTSGTASATGEIRAAGTGAPLRLETHDVSVEILDPIAVTRVVQTFRNTTGGPVEGVYLFPLPRGAQMTRFAATVDGVLREGRMVEKRAAREAYERARAAGREAALAESREEDVFSVNLARIPDGSSPRVELAYVQLLAYDAGGIAYRYPLLPRGSAPATAGRFGFVATISSVVPLTSATSDSHPLRIERTSHGATARLEAADFRPSADLHLAFRVRREETGVDVRLHRVPGEAGYALIAITPRAEIRPEDVIPRDVTFVVDVSGSMRGVKIDQARSALRSFVRSLRPADRFNIVRFSAGATRLWGGLRAADAGAVEEAIRLAESLQAGGGTNIGAALEAALADGADGRPHLVVFLTDGQPTAGETRADAIVDACVRGLRPETRIFTFGIGHDLNHRLLRQVARKSRGAAAFVEREHELELALGNFERRISSPVLSDLRLSATGATLSRVHPSDTSFLFAGDQLLVCARFEGEGEGEVRLAARDRGAERLFRCPVRFPAEHRGAPLLATLWGLKKMESLLEEIALRGEEAELRQEVVDLSLRYGIASPYTSFLVLSPDLAAAPLDGGPEAEQLLRLEAKKVASADPAGGTRGLSGASGPTSAPQPPAAPAGPSVGGRWRSADRAPAGRRDAPAAESSPTSPAKPREPSAAAAALARLDTGESPAAPSLRAALDSLTAEALRAGDARELLLAALARALAWKVGADARDRDAARALLEALAARAVEIAAEPDAARLVRVAGEAGLAVPEALRAALPPPVRSR